jgi:hypothetical protein
MVQCPGGIAGERCTLEDGHYPATPHHVSVPLTPDMGRLIESMLVDVEAAKARYEKMHRKERWMYRSWLVLFAFYCALTIWRLFV